MSAIFDFSSVLMIVLLMICTSTYIREIRPNIFDGSKVCYDVILLLLLYDQESIHECTTVL